jgi:hypothetical protein
MSAAGEPQDRVRLSNTRFGRLPTIHGSSVDRLPADVDRLPADVDRLERLPANVDRLEPRVSISAEI